MTTMREQRAAELAQLAIARAAQHAEDWGSTAAPRRPRNGHTADCPRQMDPRFRGVGRCGLCWAEGNGQAPSSQAPNQEVPQVSGVNEPAAELRACSAAGCFRPTDHPSGLCDRYYAPTTDPEGHCP